MHRRAEEDERSGGSLELSDTLCTKKLSEKYKVDGFCRCYRCNGEPLPLFAKMQRAESIEPCGVEKDKSTRQGNGGKNVLDGDRDRVLGYVNFKELIAWARTNPADPTLRGIARPVHLVAPEESSAALLKVFVDQHIHMAIVSSKEGKTLGLKTTSRQPIS